MQMFQLLSTLDQGLDPSACKIHLAVYNGKENPLDEYLAGRFDKWQSWQKKQNFKRELVVALISLPERDRWLFAGLYRSHGCTFVGEPHPHPHYQYDLEPCSSTAELAGRLVVDFKRSGRQSYLNAGRWAEQFRVTEIRREKLQVADFPGYTWTLLTKSKLDLVVRTDAPSWRAALSNVAGVYVIADRETGNLYIGSATGGGGIWSRWCAYSATGHGGNRELRRLLRERGADHSQHFQFGVLETADTHASVDDVLRRESYWKELLLTHEHGYNAN